MADTTRARKEVLEEEDQTFVAITLVSSQKVDRVDTETILQEGFTTPVTGIEVARMAPVREVLPYLEEIINLIILTNGIISPLSHSKFDSQPVGGRLKFFFNNWRSKARGS